MFNTKGIIDEVSSSIYSREHENFSLLNCTINVVHYIHVHQLLMSIDISLRALKPLTSQLYCSWYPLNTGSPTVNVRRYFPNSFESVYFSIALLIIVFFSDDITNELKNHQ